MTTTLDALIDTARRAGHHDLASRLARYTSLDDMRASDTGAEDAFWFCARVAGGRVLELEPVIAEHAYWAWRYARWIVRGRWPEGEETIRHNPLGAVLYAWNIIGDRWPEAEPTILQSCEAICLYVEQVIRGPWPEGEGILCERGQPGHLHRYHHYIVR
ncbi:MAG: hypothetical protein KatS3mg059_1814 [Thermomicrobiales bacterium]|nr:MAG: hypothetical protein KatS3mg059_1814 [Thermomicrobiales bacterium]